MLKKLDGLRFEIFSDKYKDAGEDNWPDRCRTVAKVASSAEPADVREKYEQKFYQALGAMEFIPGGRILYGAGRKGGRQNMLNCYFIEPQDTVESIAKTISDTYKIGCSGGGIGYNFSKLRPLGDDIQNMKHSAPGAVSLIKTINVIGQEIKAGGNRRVALMGILDVNHPELFNFLKVKLDKSQLNNFNISVAVTDRFLEACENDEEWYFSWGNKKYHIYDVETEDTIHTVGALDEEDAKGRVREHLIMNPASEMEVTQRKIYAKDIWKRIWRSAVECGCPGIFNISRTNNWNCVNYFEHLSGTNPCGEIPLPSYGNCCLGHVNLNEMVLEDGSDVDWKKLARTVRTGVRFLDNILSVNHFPVSDCREVGHKSRRIGLGVMGLHYMLIKLGLKYGSEKSLEFIDRLFATIRNEAYKSSAYLARDKGSFPEFDPKQFLATDYARSLPVMTRMLIRQLGMRNGVVLTIAPTGTSGMVVGASTGVETIFAPMYFRKIKMGNAIKREVVFDPLFREYLDEGKDVSMFQGAYDVTPEEHMKVQATIQRYIDNSISKTINLPSDVDADELIETSLEFAPYVKGLTVYRAGSKGQEPLEAIPTTEENVKKYASQDAYSAKVAETSEDAVVCSIDGGDCG